MRVRTGAPFARFRRVKAALANNFAHSLIRASHVLGSLLDVAEALGVEPKQVYFWIAEMERPSSAQCRSLEKKLRSCVRGRLSCGS